jgi:hypothetical protein
MGIDGLDGEPTEQEQLADLRWHWDLAYEINLSGETWTARFLGGPGTLLAGSADELRDLIRADYAARKAAEAADGTLEMGEGERALRRLVDEGLV